MTRCYCSPSPLPLPVDCAICYGDGEFAHDELMLEIDCGRSLRRAFVHCGSRWRVRMMENFRRMMFPSGIAGASETDELECVGSGVSKVLERLIRERTLYATGG